MSVLHHSVSFYGSMFKLCFRIASYVIIMTPITLLEESVYVLHFNKTSSKTTNYYMSDSYWLCHWWSCRLLSLPCWDGWIQLNQGTRKDTPKLSSCRITNDLDAWLLLLISIHIPFERAVHDNPHSHHALWMKRESSLLKKICKRWHA